MNLLKLKEKAEKAHSFTEAETLELLDRLGDANCVIESLRAFLYEPDKIADSDKHGFLLRALETYDEICNKEDE